ncbi:hypothetical protein [Crossiella cryophila]|uniref:Uncharacterized protein n=1 Tax=Crossiella cryophila TaxID=43355 RepID=A0A7W7CE59_9PSEU|nr:hypothetical protein [Crossiella cryophila]MBB4679455.1 hypothetical protein [Crossiella cryophila]
MNDVLLFHRDGHLDAALTRTERAMVERIQQWDPDALLKAPVEDVVDQLVDAGSVRCPELLVDQVWMPAPTEVMVAYSDFGQQYARRVTRLVLVAPFTGEKAIFMFRANRGTMSPPRVLHLTENELHLVIDEPPEEPTAVRAAFDEQLDRIQQHLSWSREQIEQHNLKVGAQVPGLVAKRREHLLATRNLQAQIGYPVRRRSDADTYSVPVRRRTLQPVRSQPAGGRAAFKPEPAMSEPDYQAALRVLRNQRNALERTPSLAATLKEEQIRDLLLVGLNAQFEGDAAGELFNGEGKTDILIRVDDRNIFIGECKVWSGPKTMDEALDQLFRYLVWRDTKAAILLFIRNKDVTAVIDKAVRKIEDHPNYKRGAARSGGEEFEFTMCAQDDPEREIHLALIPFALRDC